MFFETRVGPPAVSPPWQDCCSAFLAGRVREARAAAVALRGATPLSMNDLFLCADIARACGRRAEYAALGILLRRRFPRETCARIEYAQSLAGRPAAMTAIRELNALADTCEAAHMPRVQSMLAAALARAGMRERARRHGASAEAAGSADDPAASYDLSWMYMYLTDWDAAIEHGIRAVRLAPRWPQARGALVGAHLAVGHAADAAGLLHEALDSGIEDESLDLTAALFELSQNHLDAAAGHFDRYRVRWAGARAFRPAMVAATIARWSLGQPEAARDTAAASGSGLSDLLDRARPDGRHRYIPVGYLAQRHNQCVPTAVAMIARAQGVIFDADDLFRRMRGHDGTQLWRMRQVMEDAGFTVLCLRAEPAILRAMLDLGIPLMGCTETLFGSHVEVLCGYHSGLGICYLRDPMVWYPGIVIEEALRDRYAAFGRAVIAVLSSDAARRAAVPHEWVADDVTHLLDLERARHTGQLEAAEAAAAGIPDDSPAAFLRDRLGDRVTHGPARTRRLMRAHAAHATLDPLLRWKALQILGDREAAAEMRRMANDEIRHPFYRDLAAIQSALAGETETDPRPLILGMLDRHPEIDTLWAQLSDLQAQAGDLAGAQESLGRALEIAPHAPHLHQRDAWLRLEELTYPQRLARTEDLCRKYAEAPVLRLNLANVRIDDPDGLAYESAWREYLRFFPRDPAAYTALAHWYLAQDREDMARAVFGEARRLLDTTELAPAVFESPGRTNAPPPVPVTPAGGDADPEVLLAEAARDLDEGRRPVEWPAIRRLQELAGVRTLAWHQSVRLLALRIGHAATQPSGGPTGGRIAPLLPSCLPGPIEASASLFLEWLRISSLPRPAAAAILEWIVRCVGTAPRLMRLRFMVAVLRDQAGFVQRSIEDLQRLCLECPGYSPPLHQMARVLAGQGRIHEASERFRQCLDGEPGHSAAIEALRNIDDMLARPAEALGWHSRLVRRHPYAFDLYLEAVRRTEAASGVESALAQTERTGSRMPPAFVAAAKCDVLLRAGRGAEATRLLHPFVAAGADLWPVHATRLALAVQQGTPSDIEALTLAGMERWPRQPWLAQVHAESLANRKPRDAMAFIDGRFAAGLGDATLAFLRLRYGEPTARQAIRCALDTPEAHRAAAIDCYATALSRPEWHGEETAFLEWSAARAPRLLHLRSRLAMLHDMAQRHREAQAVAADLLAEDPDNPACLHLMGRCLQDVDPRAAGTYLVRAVEKDRSSEYLLALARNYQVSGDRRQAVALYREVVALNPGSAMALTNLYLLDEDPRTLREPICRAIDSGDPHAEQYFHVTSVLVALTTRSEVPEAWIVGAARRWEMLGCEAPFMDERERLSKALFAWHTARGEHEMARRYGGHAVQIAARLSWPGLRWVPDKPRR